MITESLPLWKYVLSMCNNYDPAFPLPNLSNGFGRVEVLHNNRTIELHFIDIVEDKTNMGRIFHLHPPCSVEEC